MVTNRLFHVALIASFWSSSARNAEAQRGPVGRGPTILRLHDGRNQLDLLGNGKPGVVDVGDRENFNAHGFHIAAFQVRAQIYPSDTTSATEWQLMPFFGGPDDPASGEDLFRTQEGADCNLRDLRILRRSSRSAIEIVIAQRELGASFADSAAVRFDYYEVRRNTDGTVGFPSYYFRYTRTTVAKGRYCDVDDAFDRELHLGRSGILVWDGPR